MQNAYLSALIAVSLFAAFAVTAANANVSPLWMVLTDNAVKDEPVMATGVTAAAEPALSQTEELCRRLLDRDQPWNDWNNVVGIRNGQTVTFDLKKTRLVGSVQLNFNQGVAPTTAQISVANHDKGPWTEFGTVTAEDEKGWKGATVPDGRQARYVKLSFTLGEGIRHLNEVKIWGRRGDEPGAQVVLPSEKDKSGNIVLTRDGKPRASIVVASQPTRKALTAAADLQDYVFRMSGAVLPIRTDDRQWTGTLILVGPSKLLSKAGVQVPRGYPANETTIIKTVGTSIALVGNDEGTFTGTEFAVQTLLEKLGCGWFCPDPLWQPVPEKKTIAVGPLDIRHTPEFKHRNVWIGLGKRWYQYGLGLSLGHSHSALFPPAEYFKDHPEYYALIGGKRTSEGEWQLCTSNPDVIKLTIQKAQEYFDKNPEQVTFSLGNNDSGGFCECEECAKTGSNPGARMLSFSNVVARGLRKTHPDKYVTQFSYWYTYTAPTEQMTAEPGVIIVAVGQGCHAHPIEEPSCPNYTGFKANFERWAATGATMGFYEWLIPGCSHLHWRKIPLSSPETRLLRTRSFFARTVWSGGPTSRSTHTRRKHIPCAGRCSMLRQRECGIPV